jgi:hypothetical protein
LKRKVLWREGGLRILVGFAVEALTPRVLRRDKGRAGGWDREGGQTWTPARCLYGRSAGIDSEAEDATGAHACEVEAFEGVVDHFDAASICGGLDIGGGGEPRSRA